MVSRQFTICVWNSQKIAMNLGSFKTTRLYGISRSFLSELEDRIKD
jgi:hypothetical protein